MKMLAAFALAVLAAAPVFAQSKEYQGPVRSSAATITTDQIIVQWRNGSKSTVTASSAIQRSSKLSSTAGIAIRHKRRGAGDADVFKLDRFMTNSELQTVLERLNADPDVAYAVADQRRFAQLQPSDPLVPDQWYLLSAETAATRTDQAWDVTTGSSTTIVAVLDTGVRPDHPDITDKLLPGYDFVSEPAMANDGDGRDPDPSDPGDWVSAADRNQTVFRNCNTGASSWHGTRVSSLIAAETDDGAGLAGLGWNALILPVRVLGKCGGYDSDIIDAMRWSAGLPVGDLALNPTPAKIINLSLGGNGTCSALYQAAVNEVTAMGTLIVASVGNDGIQVGVPANCDNVLGVSGVRHAGTKVGYSSLGPGADIAAPAGNCVNTTITDQTPCVYSVLAAIDTGTTTPVAPGYTDKVQRPNFGTSFSAPLVSGAVALLHAVYPTLTPAQFSAVVQGTATAFPTTSTTTTNICRAPNGIVQGEECICTTSTCGAGMLNTAAAVNALAMPFGVIQSPSTINPNTSVTIDGRNSFDVNGGTALASYQWSVLNVTGATPTIADASSASTTLQVTGTSTFTLRLSVTNAAGVTDDTDVAMATAAPTPSSPINPGGGGGGGGSFDWWLLLLGLLPLALPGPRRRKVARVRGRTTRNPPMSELHDAGNVSAVRSQRRRRRQNFPE